MQDNAVATARGGLSKRDLDLGFHGLTHTDHRALCLLVSLKWVLKWRRGGTAPSRPSAVPSAFPRLPKASTRVLIDRAYPICSNSAGAGVRYTERVRVRVSRVPPLILTKARSPRCAKRNRHPVFAAVLSFHTVYTIVHDIAAALSRRPVPYAIIHLRNPSAIYTTSYTQLPFEMYTGNRENLFLGNLAKRVNPVSYHAYHAVISTD